MDLTKLYRSNSKSWNLHIDFNEKNIYRTSGSIPLSMAEFLKNENLKFLKIEILRMDLIVYLMFLLEKNSPQREGKKACRNSNGDHNSLINCTWSASVTDGWLFLTFSIWSLDKSKVTEWSLHIKSMTAFNTA